MARNPDRPLSPHLSIWKWGWAMSVSILHRITGNGLAFVGLGLLTWWLWALADGSKSYDKFIAFTQYELGPVPIVTLVLVGLTWAFWQHLLSGIRHLVLDTGAGFERRVNRFWSIMVIVGAFALTAVTWVIALGVYA